MEKKVLFVVSTLSPTGPTNQLYNIIKYMDPSQFSKMILTLSPEPENTALPRFSEAGISVQSLELSRFGSILFGASRLKRFVSKIKPDLVHTNGIRADMLAAFCLKDIPRMATLRSFPYHDYAMQYGKIKGTYMAKEHLNALRKIECPVGCSKTTANLVFQRCGFDLHVVQNGVDNSRFERCSSEQKKQIRKKLNLPLEERVFVSVGDLIIRKRPVTLIRAFLESRASDNSVLVIVGDGNLGGECERVAGGNPNVRFVGRVLNVNEYLQGSDYFISASISEGLPNVVMEAMATGLPVFLSEIDSHREILEFDQGAGRLVPVENYKKLAKTIDESENMEYDEMSNAAYGIICNHLNARNMSLKYQMLYTELCNGKIQEYMHPYNELHPVRSKGKN